jgi:dTDP-L-rhamnose 4-epimerase
MYELAEYTGTNTLGTAVLLQALLDHPVERLVVASSMSVYGEGLFVGSNGKTAMGLERTREQMQAGQWEVLDTDGQKLMPVPTTEAKPPALTSVYALSKYDQERLCLLTGKAYGIPTVALRFFNVYGPRQALSNPYTGVLAIFSSRLLNGNAPLIFEDGLQQRDFVSVHDVARACRLALEVPEAIGGVFNIGSGQAITVREVAAAIAEVMGKPNLRPELTGKYRVGDVRHCFADISLARKVLGYEPQVSFHQGLSELAEWLKGQVATDRVDEARAELERRGLTV